MKNEILEQIIQWAEKESLEMKKPVDYETNIFNTHFIVLGTYSKYVSVFKIIFIYNDTFISIRFDVYNYKNEK